MNHTEREILAEHLVNTYSDMLVRIGFTWFHNPYDAQDICQTVLMKRMEREEGFQTAELEKAWLLRVAINECKTLRRSAWFRHTVGLEEGVLPSVELPSQEEGDLFAQIQELPLKDRQIIYLRYYEGYQVKEIAELTGQSPNLISARLGRIKAKLKDRLGGQLNEQHL